MRRALISVFDKSGVAELARFLADNGVEILSTGGTARHLEDAGISTTPVSSYTGFPEVLGGRVKTLNPRVFSGLLFDRDSEAHREDMKSNDLGEIDLVAVNLYPFEETIAREGVTIGEAIEQIDIGGPSMLRAAAKNHKHVVPLCSPELYQRFIDQAGSGGISEEFRREAAISVFQKTAAYDHAIAQYLESSNKSGRPTRQLDLELVQTLRYGENPHQNAGFYRPAGKSPSFEQIQGKELSYNNLLDLDGAWRVPLSYDRPCVAIIKHTNPCGTALADNIADAFTAALEADPISAFGGILAANREVDGETASRIGTLFLEVIVAPSFSDGALEILAQKKNLRVIRAIDMEMKEESRSAAGGVLIQDRDEAGAPEQWDVATKKTPTPEQDQALRFAWTLVAHVKSNAIVLARENQSNGIGAGQMSRVDAARLAVEKAVHPVEGCVAASDAFFPFPDALELLARAGVTAIVQPGGSKRDDEVIAAADELGVAMIMTGRRHFRH